MTVDLVAQKVNYGDKSIATMADGPRKALVMVEFDPRANCSPANRRLMNSSREAAIDDELCLIQERIRGEDRWDPRDVHPAAAKTHDTKQSVHKRMTLLLRNSPSSASA